MPTARTSTRPASPDPSPLLNNPVTKRPVVLEHLTRRSPTPLRRPHFNRGVILDIGQGAGSFDYTVAEAALAQDFLPDVISSDIHSKSVNGPMQDLPTTMSKFLNLGLSLEQVIEKTTVAPAKVINFDRVRVEKLGTLQEGAPGDVAIFELGESEHGFEDTMRNRRQGRLRLQPVQTVRGGRPWGRPYPDPY